MKNLLNSINFETELLEALDWDEEELKITQAKLSEYFELCTKRDLDLVKADLDHVFSDKIALIVYNYLVEMTEKINEESVK
mgnify:CR=1 FL=1